MTNEFMRDLENQFRGIGTRLKELHFSAPSIMIHRLIDEYNSEFLEFEDEVMENAQALWGNIEVGELEPVLPEATEFEALLEDIRGLLANIKSEAGDQKAWTGIISIVDSFWATTNKYIYLIRFDKK